MNCKKGSIIEYEVGRKMILYSFHLENEEFCEFDRFINRFDIIPVNETEMEYKNDYETIILAIDQIVQRGAHNVRFRPEGNVDALPDQRCSLRLYCIRLNDGAVLFGNGGVKTSQKLKDSPDCYPHQQLLSELERRITERILDGEMFWIGDRLNGDFYFELGDCDK